MAGRCLLHCGWARVSARATRRRAEGRLGCSPRGLGAALAAKSLWAREINHTGLTELHEAGSMHERKRLMNDKSDAFIALPGGLGTLEELAEVATWSQLGLHSKPVALLDVDGFWEPLVTLLDRMAGAGLLKPTSRALIRRTRSAEEALAVLAAAEPAHPEKWITAPER
jgi:hypothetical protein